MRARGQSRRDTVDTPEKGGPRKKMDELPKSFKLKVYPSILPQDVKNTKMDPVCTTKTKAEQSGRSGGPSLKPSCSGSQDGDSGVGMDTKDLVTSGTIAADSVLISDQNISQAGGEIEMGADGLLSLQYNGTVFNKHNSDEAKYFTLQSAQYSDLFLALSDTSQFYVKGMRKQDLRNETDRHWKYLLFNKIGGNCPAGHCTDIVLQYYGNRFGSDPDEAPYYLIIEMYDDGKAPIFKVAKRSTALCYGRLGIVPL